MTARRWLRRLAPLLMALAAATVTPARAGQLVVEVAGEQVSVLAEDVSLRRTLEAIAAKTGLALRLHGDLDRQVSARVDRLSLQSALQRLLHEGYVLSDDRLVVFLRAPRPADRSSAPRHDGALGLVGDKSPQATGSVSHEAATASLQGPPALDAMRSSRRARTEHRLWTRGRRSIVTSGGIATSSPAAGAATPAYAETRSSTSAVAAAPSAVAAGTSAVAAAPLASTVVAMPRDAAGAAMAGLAGGSASIAPPQSAAAPQAVDVFEADRLAAEVEAQLNQPEPVGAPDVAAIDAIARSVQRELP